MTNFKSISNSLGLMLIAIAIAIAIAMPATVQLLKYDNEAQAYGAAAVSADSTRQLLENLVQMCSQYGENVQAAGETILSGWKARHQHFLDESVHIKREFLTSLEASSAPESEKQQARRAIEVLAPQTIEAQLTAITMPILGQPTAKASAGVCMSDMQSIADGKWELRRNDPVVASFLEASIAERKATASTDQKTPEDTASSARAYAIQVASAIRARIAPSDDFQKRSERAENPLAVVRIKVSSDGKIEEAKLMKSNGFQAWDDAVLQATQKVGVLPLMAQRKKPPVMDIEFRP